MRVRFGELSQPELAERQAVCQQAELAWRELGRGNLARARELISGIDARIELLVEREPDQGRVRSAALSIDDSSAWPLAELLLQQAPADIGCALSLGRAALPLVDALTEIEAAHGVALGRATLRVGFARGHLLEVTLGVPGGSGAEIEQIAAENLVRALLGERVFETWIGAVHAAPAPRGGPLRVLDSGAGVGAGAGVGVGARAGMGVGVAALGVAELFATVEAATRGALLGLPERARADAALRDARALEDGADWTLLEVEPFADAEPDRKHDLLLAASATPELLRCFMEGQPCSSRRFSRAGEQFVFLSYADGGSAVEARLAERARLEAALGITLQGVGSVTGVGLGVHTSYLDFALCDLETGLTRLVTSARQLGVPRHSFIQFFDSELSEEWLSIWPDSRLGER